MEILAQHSSEILAAFWVTIKLTVYSAVGALVLGTVLVAVSFIFTRVRRRWRAEKAAKMT